MEDNINMASENSFNDEESEQSLNIARRTRSHLRIDDLILNDNLDFEDVDMNLYQDPNSEGDIEYKKFLNQTYSLEDNTDNTNNNDDNDPEYVYNDDIFSHGWRFDLTEFKKDVGQTSTNLNPLEASTSNQNNYIAFNQDSLMMHAPMFQFTDPQRLSLSQDPTSNDINKSSVRRKIDMFSNPQFAKVLNQQLRQHIQLLTQTFLLTKNTMSMKAEAEEAKSHLDSYMMIFKNKSKPANLQPAIDLVNNLPTSKDLRSSIRLSWRPLPLPESVKKTIHANRNIFMYPSLMPQVAFSIMPEKLVSKKPKINFTLNEDKLLAYALDEFKGESAPYALIACLLMTAKTKTQISNHIKNIKRSPGCEENPIKLYFLNGQLPQIDLDEDAQLIESYEVLTEEELNITDEDCDTTAKTIIEVSLQFDEKPMIDTIDEKGTTENIDSIKEADKNVTTSDKLTLSEAKTQMPLEEDMKNDEEQKKLSLACNSPILYQDQDDLMNMDLDDLMAASTTISKTTIINNGNSENNKNIRNLKLRKSILKLMSHNFTLSKDMGDLIVYDFLKLAQQKLLEQNNIQLLQILANFMSNNTRDAKNENVNAAIYHEITSYLLKINAPPELLDRAVLLLNLDQANECGCSFNYLYWLKFFQFMQHVELYHEGMEIFEKKLGRLIDAIQKDDSHKIKLAIGNLINKHPFLKREFESLSLDGKPHQTLLNCDEDFDDITEPMASFQCDSELVESSKYIEHFNPKLTKEELAYASQTCPCKCHPGPTVNDSQLSHHCEKCNLKFIKGRMYLVSKIKPILAEWSYTERVPMTTKGKDAFADPIVWTLEEDREILEFCRTKAEQHDETVSFDNNTFEELVLKRRAESSGGQSYKKSAEEIAMRFNQLMDLYKDENTSNAQPV